MPELLAPAGNFEKLKTALAMGADAVYAAGKAFGLRSQADNFTLEELEEAIQFVHRHHKKIYITVNILAHPDHLEAIYRFIEWLIPIQPDGIIASDLGVIAMIRNQYPQLPIHLSTQFSTTNAETIQALQDRFSIRRFNLARELSADEIASIRSSVPSAELEMFIHGAMCMAYSGRCLLSSVLAGRSSNLGECTQPCRWDFSLVESSRSSESYPIEEDSYGSYILNSKDLCLIDYLPRIVSLGLNALKIEGRMKSLNYVATVVSVYRQALDTLADHPERYPERLEKWQTQLAEADNRYYTTGFFTGRDRLNMQNYSGIAYARQYRTIGQVRRIYEKTWILIQIKNPIQRGDRVEVLTADGRIIPFTLEEFYDIFRQPADQAHPNDFIFIAYTPELPIEAILRQKI
ncbi:MAG: U32 family peptidase [Candidatus Delongbacteria bacterium]|nr:U32 family peptidase [Candidatus Delongbacteria bacterium]